jgi:hypothetical protein
MLTKNHPIWKILAAIAFEEYELEFLVIKKL